MDECILTNKTECWEHRYLYMYVRWFCGQEWYCIYGDMVAALQIAKANIQKHYIVVGLLDYLPDFYQALEILLPKHFSGISDLHRRRNLFCLML